MTSRELLDGAFSKSTHRLHGFVSEIATLADPDPGLKRLAEREAALETFASHDDIWWLGELRAQAPKSSMRDLVLQRRPGPVSLWKRVSGFPGGRKAVEELNRCLPPRGDVAAEAVWRQLVEEVRVRHGVILQRVRFTPIRIDESSGASLLRVGTTASDSQPLSDLSPLMAGLPAAWASDLQVFAFTERHASDPAAAGANVCAEMMATLSKKP
jgi:hypothetical protein